MPPDLLFLMVDTARADAFSPWNPSAATPAFGRVAAEGWTYSSARSTAPWTLPSTASLFSGRLPTEHGITGDCFRWTDGRPSSPAAAVAGWDGPWLPEDLRARGYRTWAASCNAWISPWGGFDRGFDRFVYLQDQARLPAAGPPLWLRRTRRALWGIDRGGAQALLEFRRTLAERGDSPLFVFVDLMEVHSPYDPPGRFYPFAPWRRPSTRALTVGETRFLSYNARVGVPPPGYVPTIRTLYFRAARYADRLLGGFVDALRDRRRPAVVVVLADHGENLGEHGLFHHNSSLHETLLHVPLAVWTTGVDLGAGLVERTVSLGDLAAWAKRVADGTVAPFGLAPEDGQTMCSEYESAARHNGIPGGVRDALQRPGAQAPPALLAHAGAAFVRGRRKYVAIEGGDDSLFDLEADPLERRNLLATGVDHEGEFADAVAAWKERRRSQRTYPVGKVAEDEMASHLGMLGYLE